MKGLSQIGWIIAGFIIAIIFVFLSIFLLNIFSGKGIEQASEGDCRNWIYNYCFQWSLNGWQKSDEKLKEMILKKCEKYLEPPGPFVGFKENTLEYCKTYVPTYEG